MLELERQGLLRRAEWLEWCEAEGIGRYGIAPCVYHDLWQQPLHSATRTPA